MTAFMIVIISMIYINNICNTWTREIDLIHTLYRFNIESPDTFFIVRVHDNQHRDHPSRDVSFASLHFGWGRRDFGVAYLQHDPWLGPECGLC